MSNAWVSGRYPNRYHTIESVTSLLKTKFPDIDGEDFKVQVPSEPLIVCHIASLICVLDGEIEHHMDCTRSGRGRECKLRLKGRD